jgi:hypothetical protein
MTGGGESQKQIVAFNGIWMPIEDFLSGQKLSAPIQDVLAVLDKSTYTEDLIKIGYLLANHPTTKKILREYVEAFLLHVPVKA